MKGRIEKPLRDSHGIKRWIKSAGTSLGLLCACVLVVSSAVWIFTIRASTDQFKPSHRHVDHPVEQTSKKDLQNGELQADQATMHQIEVPPDCREVYFLSGPGLASQYSGDLPQVSVVGTNADHLVLRGTDEGMCTLWLQDGWVLMPVKAHNDETEEALGDESEQVEQPVASIAGGLSTSDFEQAVVRIAEDRYRLLMPFLVSVLEAGGEAVTGADLVAQADGSGTLLKGRSGVYGMLGLREGDIIVSANDVRLETVDDLAEAFESVTARERLVIRLIREGTSRIIAYEAM